MDSTTALPVAVPSVISSTNWLGIVKSAGSLITSTAYVLTALVLRSAGYIYTATTWLLSWTYSVAAWPVARIFDVLRVLLSPVTYTLSYALIPVNLVLSFLGRLRPLYTYLGSAAFIGIVAGLMLKFASDYIVVILGLDRDNSQQLDGEIKSSMTAAGSTANTRSSSYTTATSSQSAYSRSAVTAPSTAPTTTSTSRLLKMEDDKSDIVQDEVWQWLEEFNPGQPTVAADNNNLADAPPPPLKQRPPGLLSLTILEESSSEGGN